MNLQDNDFALFGLPPVYAQDIGTIETRWKILQRQIHPDKFAAQGTTAQRLSMQWSVRINEAYQRLKDPISRAAYLCQLHGVSVDVERNTAMPAEFLMQQMAWREALDDAQTPDELQVLNNEVQHAQQKALLELEQVIDQEHNYELASTCIQALMFMHKFAQTLQLRIAQHT